MEGVMKNSNVPSMLAGFLCLILLSFLVAAPAFSTPIVFTASGTAGDGRPENAKATIDFTSLTNMTITLENTAGPGELGGISSVLDGFKFTFSSAPASITLSEVDPIKVVDCSSGTCVDSLTGASPYSWGVSGTLANPLLAAGTTSFKPYGIINGNIETTDGIPNAQHNPYLMGPVVFKFTLTGLDAIPNISSADFYFGTVPDIQRGVPGTPVPEPSTLFLIGSGLIALLFTVRRRKI
jgi:hypothetical protein